MSSPQLFSRDTAFELLICIDFEATCEKDDTNYFNEIIEFPAILIDTKRKTAISEFHRYVRPTVNPILSTFCKSLTGVTQEQVDSANTFEYVLTEFEEWLHTHNAVDSKRASILCDGIWDIKKFIFIEFSKLSHVNGDMNELFSSWIDCRESFKYFCRTRSPRISAPHRVTLATMLDTLGFSFDGRPHCGMDDTRNISRMVIDILNRGGAKCFRTTNMVDFDSTEDSFSTPNFPPIHNTFSKYDDVLSDTNIEIRAINRILDFDHQHNPLSTHNRFQLFRFKGTLQQLRTAFGSLHIVDTPSAPCSILFQTSGVRVAGMRETPAVRMRKIDITQLNMSTIFGYDDVFEYERSDSQEKIIFVDGNVEFRRCCFKGTFSDIKRAINYCKLTVWNASITVNLAVPRMAKILRSELFPSPRSMETYFSGITDVGSSDLITSSSEDSEDEGDESNASENITPLFDGLELINPSSLEPKNFSKHLYRKVKKLCHITGSTKLDPPRQAPTTDGSDVSLESSWILWRKSLLNRRSELHSLRRSRRKQFVRLSGSPQSSQSYSFGSRKNQNQSRSRSSSTGESGDDDFESQFASSPASPPHMKSSPITQLSSEFSALSFARPRWHSK